MNFKALLEKAKNFDYKLVAFEEEAKEGKQRTCFYVLKNIKAGQSLLFVFGPEGGLAEKEIE